MGDLSTAGARTGGPGRVGEAGVAPRPETWSGKRLVLIGGGVTGRVILPDDCREARVGDG